MKTVVKILSFVLLLLVVLAGITFLSFKYYPEETSRAMLPEVNNVQVSSSKVGRDNSMYMNVKADLSTNILPYLMDSLSYKGVLYGDTITRGMKKFATMTAEQKRSNTLNLPMEIQYKKLGKKIKAHQGEKSTIQFLGTAYYHLPIVGRQSVQFTKDVPFQMIVIPEIKVDAIKIEKVGLNDTKMKVRLKITNPNDIDFHINGMKYTMEIPDYLNTKGETTDDYHLKANGTSMIEVSMKSDIDQPVKAVWKGIKGDEFPYKMKTDMNIQPSVKDMDDIDFSTELEGHVGADDVKNLLKGDKEKS